MMDESLTENRLLKWSGKLILIMKGDSLQQNINILNDREERIHRSVSTLKLSPYDRRFIIRTISSTIDKISYTKQEKEQELFYKIMMMEKILQQRMDFNKKSGILNKTKISRHNCVSTDFNVAINKKFSIKLHKMEKTENRKQNLYVIFYGYITYPDTDRWYISPIWLYTIDHTHYTNYNSAQEKRESSLRQKHNNISYYGVQQISYLSKEKAKAISNKRKNMNDEQKIDQCRTQRTKFRHFLQQKQWLWNQQKNKRKNRKQKKNTEDLKRGSRFHDFCRRNNLKINFNEYTSDRPIISFLNKSPLPTHWKIKKINQRFAIRKLLTTAHDKGKYYKLEIEIKDKFQHLAAMKQTQCKDLFKELRPWKHLQTNITAKHYYILPEENEYYINNQKRCDQKIDTHELITEGSFIPIEYLQFLSIIIKKNWEPEFIQLSITIQDNIKKFIMVKYDLYNNSLPKQINEEDSDGKTNLYGIKRKFWESTGRGTKIKEKQTTFSYEELAWYLEYIFIHKDVFMIRNRFSTAYVKNDLPRLTSNVDCAHRYQIGTLIQNQLIPIDKMNKKTYPLIIKEEREDQQSQENVNPKRFKKEEDDTEINGTTIRNIQ